MASGRSWTPISVVWGPRSGAISAGIVSAGGAARSHKVAKRLARLYLPGVPRRLVLVFLLGVQGLLGGCTNRETVSKEFGAPCFTASDCTSRCLPRTIWPGGFCTRPCSFDDDCPVGALCAVGVCLYACFDDQDCSLLTDGWDCLPLSGKLVCRPDSLELPDAGP